MKFPAVCIFASLAASLCCGCSNTENENAPAVSRTRVHQERPFDTEKLNHSQDFQPIEGTEEEPTPTPGTAENETENEPAPEVQQLPTAVRVPDRRGLVKSPYDPQGRYIDVSGLPPGSEAIDPYSGKHFIVPQ